MKKCIINPNIAPVFYVEKSDTEWTELYDNAKKCTIMREKTRFDNEWKINPIIY